tara:strand:+ start:3410 stop:4432 length:1023 start_codon:yes stop_codon:yes gene_type:complete
MKFILHILILIMLSGNVLCNESIFNVNNIKIDKNDTQTLENSFKKAFEKFSQRVLLDKDSKLISNVNKDQIKNLVSHYQIVNKKVDNKDIAILNLFFDKKKINEFFLKKNVSYSDLFNLDFVLMPIHQNEEEIFIYNNNFFYDNWVIDNQSNNEVLQYVMPIENIENIELIKKYKESLEDLKVEEILKDYDLKNSALILIFERENNYKIFIKSIVSNKKVNYNFSINKLNQKKINERQKVISKIKNKILDISKSQNLIDLSTPAFFNSNLKINDIDNLMNVQKILDKIDLIEYYSVEEIINNEVKLKIKYYGRVDKIIKVLEEKGLSVINVNNSWSIELI